MYSPPAVPAWTSIWKLGLAAENLFAKDSPEAYFELGIQAGAETYGSTLSGSATVEFGRRSYRLDQVTLDPGLTDQVITDEDIASTYSDFNYWEIWLMGSWRIGSDLSLDLLATYEPEKHTEQDDDTTLGFASLRLVWRR